MHTRVTSRRWTAEEVAELRRLSHHAPAEAIAAALGRTVSAIRTKAAQKRMALHNDAPRQGPPRLRLPWEQAAAPLDMSASAHETGKGKWW